MRGFSIIFLSWQILLPCLALFQFSCPAQVIAQTSNGISASEGERSEEGIDVNSLTLDQLENSAIASYEEKKLENALALLKILLKRERSELGVGYPSIANTFDWMAAVSFDMGDYAQAVNYYLQELQHWSEYDPSNLQEIAEAFEDLGHTYFYLGEFKKSESYLSESLNKLERLSSDMALKDRLRVLGKLSYLYKYQGFFGAALKKQEQILNISTNLYGETSLETAVAFRELGYMHQMQTEYAKAKVMYEKALTIRSQRLPQGNILIAFSLNDMGVVHRELRELDISLEFFMRALEKYKNLEGLESLNVALVLDNIGTNHQYKGNNKDAEVAFLKALSTREKILGPFHEQVGTTLNNIGLFYASNMDDYAKSNSYLARSVAIVEKQNGPNSHKVLAPVLNLAANYASLHDYERAHEYAMRLLKIQEGSLGLDHPNTIPLFSTLGKVYLSMGELDLARAYVEKEITLTEKVHGKKHGNIPALVRLGMIDRENGDLLNAEIIYKSVIQHLSQSNVPGNPGWRSGILVNLSQVYRDLGDFENAQNMLIEALHLIENEYGNADKRLVDPLRDLAILWDIGGYYVESEKYFKRALAIAGDHYSPNSPEIGNIISSFAISLKNAKRYDEALELYEKSIEIYKSIYNEDNLMLATIYSNLGVYFLSLGQYSQSSYWLEKALDIRRRKLEGDDLAYLDSLSLLAKSSIAQGDTAKAIGLYQKRVSGMNGFFNETLPYLPREKRKFAINRLGVNDGLFALSNTNAEASALALYARLNHHGLLSEFERKQALILSSPESGKSKILLSELKSVIQKLASLALPKEVRKLLKERQEELEKQLYRSIPKLSPRVIDVGQVAAALPSDGVLIEFQRYWLMDTESGEANALYLAMVLKPNGTVRVIDLGEAAILDQAITDAVSTVREALEDSDQKFELVSQLLLEPLQEATAGAKTWFVSPDSELNRLPFAALQVPGGKGYLTDAVDLRLLTSGRELLDLKQPSPAAKSVALVVADPAYDRSSSPVSTAVAPKDRGKSSDRRRRSSDLPEQLKWAPLPATAEEGETVKALTGGSLLVQQQATAEAVKSIPAPKILHLATHSFYLPNQPQQQPESGSGLLDQRGSRGVVQTSSLQGESPLLRSGIALAGANQPNADPQDDGYLTALEVAQLSWEVTDLVVISACESGLGDLQVGEGVYGLKRAIAVAGARSSLLSLWKVDDSATAAFMESFYQRLKQGQGKADALATTQSEFRKHPREMWREPYVWAAFQLSGDWGPVKGL